MDKENKPLKSVSTANDKNNPNEVTFTPFRVKVKLRLGQYTGIMNKWICTIHGEKREVPMREVEWYCMTPEDAVHSFKESEIESFTISGQYPNPYIK